MNTTRKTACLVGCATLFAFGQAAQAALVTQGFTYAVASACSGGVGAGLTGNHFHSNTGGSFGNPAGLAEVGEYGGTSCEEVRGLSEYNLAGLAAGSAFVTFDVYKSGGLFTGSNDVPFLGTIGITAYQGDNSEDVSDFQAASIGSVGSFSTAGLLVGNTLSFDITSIFNTAIGAGSNSLGIRLAALTDPNRGAWVFNNFRLTSSDDTTQVPEPASIALFSLGLLALGFGRARRRK